MAAEFNLYVDVISKRLVLGLSNAGQFTFPDLNQGDSLALKIYPVRPTYSTVAPFYSLAGVSGLTVEVAVGPRAGNESLYAYTNTFTPVATAGYLSGELNLNTNALNTAIGTGDSIVTFLEIRLTESSSTRAVYQGQVKIVACVVGPGAAGELPEAATEYLTKAECYALFVKWVNSDTNSHGKPITLYAANGTTQRILGVSDAGEAQDDIVI